MFNKEELEEIKKEIKKFFSKMNFDTEVEVLPPKDSTLSVNIKTDKSEILIGERGEILFQIHHLIGAILKKKFKKAFYLDLDISSYKKKKIEYLRELARSVADEVSLTKKERILEPMSAYERRIIHLELASRPDVITESIGKEPKRRVVIKPYP